MKLATLLIGTLLLGGCSTLGLLGTLSDDASDGILIKVSRDSKQADAMYEDLIILHEGFSSTPYMDNGGISIGYGRNFTTNGLSEDEARYLLRNDLKRLRSALPGVVSNFNDLDHARYGVVLSMGYNLGLNGLSGFKRMIAAIEARQFHVAADEMRRSEWCGQVGVRCRDLAYMMETGDAGS